MDKKTPLTQSKARLESAKTHGSREKLARPEATRASILRSSKEEIKEFIELEKQAKDTRPAVTLAKPQADFFKGALQKKPSDAKLSVYDYGREALKSRMQFGAVLKWEKKLSSLVSKDSSVCGASGPQASYVALASSNPANSLLNTNTSLQSSASKPRAHRESATHNSALKKHVPNKSQGLENCKILPDSQAPHPPPACTSAQEATNPQAVAPSARARESFKSSVDEDQLVDLGLLEEYKLRLEEVCVKQIDLVGAGEQVTQRVQQLQASIEAQKTQLVDKIERELLHTLGIFEDLLPKNLVRPAHAEKPRHAAVAPEGHEARLGRLVRAVAAVHAQVRLAQAAPAPRTRRSRRSPTSRRSSSRCRACA